MDSFIQNFVASIATSHTGRLPQQEKRIRDLLADFKCSYFEGKTYAMAILNY